MRRRRLASPKQAAARLLTSRAVKLRELLAGLWILLMPVAPVAGLGLAAPPAAAAATVVAQEPAVEVPEEPPADEEPPWTARYLAPTVLALGAVVLALVVVVYAIRVRGRYRVVR